jgi:hypothetical protein
MTTRDATFVSAAPGWNVVRLIKPSGISLDPIIAWAIDASGHALPVTLAGLIEDPDAIKYPDRRVEVEGSVFAWEDYLGMLGEQARP